MTARPRFDREYIEAQFRRLDEGLSAPLDVYLVGGGALSIRGLKVTTKDIDVVVTDEVAHRRLHETLLRVGFVEVTELDSDYERLGAASCLQNADGLQFDVFDRQVVNQLLLSTDMQGRSAEYGPFDRLTLYLVSIEDVFLFKGVATRTDDIGDMAAVVQAGLDFEVVLDEIEAQIDLLGDDLFVTWVSEALDELNDQFGITTPIEGRVEALAARYHDGLEVQLAVDGPTSKAKLEAEVGISSVELAERLDYLERMGRVRVEGKVVRAVPQ